MPPPRRRALSRRNAAESCGKKIEDKSQHTRSKKRPFSIAIAPSLPLFLSIRAHFLPSSSDQNARRRRGCLRPELPCGGSEEQSLEKRGSLRASAGALFSPCFSSSHGGEENPDLDHHHLCRHCRARSLRGAPERPSPRQRRQALCLKELDLARLPDQIPRVRRR